MFAKLVAANDPAPVADLGSGPGHVTARLPDLGVPAFGVDLSPATVTLAREAHPHVRFHVRSMQPRRSTRRNSRSQTLPSKHQDARRENRRGILHSLLGGDHEGHDAATIRHIFSEWPEGISLYGDRLPVFCSDDSASENGQKYLCRHRIPPISTNRRQLMEYILPQTGKPVTLRSYGDPVTLPCDLHIGNTDQKRLQRYLGGNLHGVINATPEEARLLSPDILLHVNSD
ncbi:class I SAM-dependent methyltransferase [Streptomyces collinus]|uniref:class I SAM-dependent methyltransferase n=1 Tax=Streptomyces collinus TaxID=42684 RepID=UPI0036ED251D